MTVPSLTALLKEYNRALAYTEALVDDLTDDEMLWRPNRDSSAIGWHLGHQAAVSHFLVRNLTAAEPRLDAELEQLMDSATAERDRGALPSPARILDYRVEVANRVRFGVDAIDQGNVGAPNQLRMIATTMLTAIINHEYQHDKWVGEVRESAHGKDLPPEPTSPLLSVVDGYLIITGEAIQPEHT